MSHVALVIPTLDRIGGAERQVLLLAKGLICRGWHVTVVVLSGAGGAAADELRAAGIDFVSLEMRKGLADPRGWLRFHRWLRRERPEVVHAHLPHAAWLARWSRLAAPVPVLVDTIHSSSTGTLGRRLGYQFSNWFADRSTAVSDAVADAYLSGRMVSENKLLVLPNGVDVEAWRPNSEVRAAVRRELGIENEFLWLAAGRLEPVKDYATLLHAMAAMPEQAHLAIAGSGPLGDELRRMSHDLGLDCRVCFLGFQSDVRRWMQAADAFVLSSRWEGLSMALLEAAACGLPAVATDVPGTRETILEGETGQFALAGSAIGLKTAMARLIALSPEARRAMGERARRFVIQRFSLERILDQWESLYAELLRRNPRAKRWGRAWFLFPSE